MLDKALSIGQSPPFDFGFLERLAAEVMPQLLRI